MNVDKFSRSNKIAYYKAFNNYERLINDPISYISDYLNYGDKNLKMKSPDDLKYYHTISIYLLGLLFYSNSKKINELVSEYINKNEDDEFTYSWFIGAFIHDLGYSVVTNDIYQNIFNSRSIKQVEQKLLKKIVKLKNKMSNVVPVEIRNNLDKYHEYRKWLNDNNKGAHEYVDHGILAGVFFIDNRKNEFKRKKAEGELEKISPGVYRDKNTNLKWSNNILNGIQYNMASIICAHNVFYQKPNSEFAMQYINIEMSDLITEEPKFTLQQYPLFFLFQLVDTIDVFKKYNIHNKELTMKDKLIKVFRDIDYSFDEDCITMVFINFDEEFLNNYFDELREQEYWLPIKVSKRANEIKLLI